MAGANVAKIIPLEDAAAWLRLQPDELRRYIADPLARGWRVTLVKVGPSLTLLQERA